MRTSGTVTTCEVSTSSRRSPRESTSERAWRTSSATRCWRCEGPAEGSKRLGTDSLLHEGQELPERLRRRAGPARHRRPDTQSPENRHQVLGRQVPELHATPRGRGGYL